LLFAHLLTWCVGTLALATPTLAFPQDEESAQQRPPAIPPRHAAEYANQVGRAAQQIADEYVQPVPVQRLAAKAIQGLYTATETPLPEKLRGDLDEIFKGTDLREELRQARLVLGNPSPISSHYRRDIRISIQAMLSSLDPYCMYLSMEDTMRFNQRGLSNIGILLEERDPGGPCIIQTVVLGGPAEQAGLKPGDELTAINGKAVPRDRPARLVVQDLDGPPDTPVEVTIRSLNEENPRTVKVTRNFVREESVQGHRRIGEGGSTWEYLLGTRQKIALIRLGTITGTGETTTDAPSTPEQVLQILKELQQTGLTGLVLDLRDCPGGSMQGALDVVSLFQPEGVIASTRYRSAHRGITPPYRAQRVEGGLYRTPMAVLIGPNTMGGGELIAAALQDHSRAIIIGQRTRGKASIQETKTLDSLSTSYHQIRLTTGYFLRPNGGNLNRFTDSKPTDEWGVHPDTDFEVRLPPIMLRQVRIWRLQQDRGTPNGNQPLPLDQLANDPVLHAAVQSLLQKK
jgi:C-terminal peptidase prc